MSFPKCFDSLRQYRQWLEIAERCDPSDSGYCTDCTPTYQRRMVAQGRCAYPRTAFRTDDDGGVDGRRPREERNGYRGSL